MEAGHIISGIRQTASRLAESITHTKCSSSPSAAPAAEPRIVALDGLRGLMTIMVVISHFFAEVPHGFSGFSFGWIGVEMFFVLSGYLVGRLILEKMDRANFVVVFYIRRVCRTLPVYFFCVVLVFALMTAFSNRPWADPEAAFPLWSYLTFFQNFYMVSTDTIGAHWLSPTWTLTVEEHFYLLAPAVFFFVPRHRLIAVFSCAIAVSVFYRYLVFGLDLFPRTAGLCLLPGVANGLLCGLIAAILIKTEGIDWKRYDLVLRAGPLAALIITIALHLIGDDKAAIFHIWSGLVVSIGCAMYILAIVRGSPEGKRLEHPFYCFFGTNSYSIYLTHLTVLGLMHGLLLNMTPDISTATQMAVTIAALPVSAFTGWLFTQIVEHPITNYGRTWQWSKELRAPKVSTSSTPVAGLKLAS